MTIRLYDLLGEEDRRYSQYCWRAKLALKHKGLDFDIIPVTLMDKEAIAFANSESVPVLVDGDIIKTDSWEIAVYLDSAYKNTPSLFGSDIGLGVTRCINSWSDRAVNVALGPLIARDILNATHLNDKQYLRESLEKLFNKSLEEVQEGREGRLKNFYRVLDPIRTTFRKGQNYICGDAPGYADYVVFSQFQWARVVSSFQLLEQNDPVFAWRERMLDLYEGYARKTISYDISG